MSVRYPGRLCELGVIDRHGPIGSSTMVSTATPAGTSNHAHERQADTMTDNSGSADAVVIERSFDAAVELIWAMWTDPKHFAAWYGPAGADHSRRKDGRACRGHAPR